MFIIKSKFKPSINLIITKEETINKLNSYLNYVEYKTSNNNTDYTPFNFCANLYYTTVRTVGEKYLTLRDDVDLLFICMSHKNKIKYYNKRFANRFSKAAHCKTSLKEFWDYKCSNYWYPQDQHKKRVEIVKTYLDILERSNTPFQFKLNLIKQVLK